MTRGPSAKALSPTASPLPDSFFFLDNEQLHPDVSDDLSHNEPLSDAGNTWAWSLSSKYASRAVDSVTPRASFAQPGTRSPLKFSATTSTPPKDLARQGGIPKEALVSGRHSVAMGEGLTSATVGSASFFDVHGCDRASRPVLFVGLLSSVLVVQIVGPTTVSHKIEPLADGSVRVWYTPGVSGRYTLRISVRVSAGSTRIEPLPGFPLTLDVAPAKVHTPRGERRRMNEGDGIDSSGGRSTGRRSGGKTDGGGGKAGSGEEGGGEHRVTSTLTSMSGGGHGGIRAADVRLRAPRGLMAHANVGEAARVELLAPLIGNRRVELPGRMKCVLHLQSPWFEPEREALEAVGALPTAATAATAGKRSKGERFFTGRISFAPHAMQPGAHQLQPPPGFAPPTGFASPSVFSSSPQPERRLFGGHVNESVKAVLAWQGESSSLGGTLLLASFCVARAGNYLVHVTLDEAHVSGSPICLRVSPGEACPARCYAKGNALEMAEAGRHETVGVWLRDKHGNARRHSDEPIAGELVASLELLTASNGPNAEAEAARRRSSGGGGASSASATASVSRLSDGSFAVGYCVREAGVWALAMSLDGEPIANSPFAISVYPGAVHPASCEVYGNSLHHALAGSPAEIQIVARDRLGNRVRDGGARFLLELLLLDDETRPALVGDVVDHGDGRYSARYTCPDAGRHAISLTYAADGAALYGSPFLLTVTPAEACANKCAVVPPVRKAKPKRFNVLDAAWSDGAGSGARPIARSPSASPTVRREPGDDVDVVLNAGGDVFIGLRVADRFGNPTPFATDMLNISIDEIGESLVGPNGVAVAPVAEFSVRSLHELVPSAEAGGDVRTSGDGRLGGDKVRPTTPRASVSADRAARALACATGRSTSSTSSRPGSNAASSRNPAPPTSPSRDTNAAELASVQRGDSGLLTARLYRACNHRISIRLGAVELPGSPVIVRVEPTGVAAQYCYIAHDALRAAAEAKDAPMAGAASTGTGGMSRAAALTLLTADAYGNPLTAGGASVGAKMSGPGACATAVEDHGDGSYTVSWGAALSGAYRLSVLVSGAHVQGSPFGVYVENAQPGSPRLPPPSPRVDAGAIVRSGSVLSAGAGGGGSLSPAVVSCVATPSPRLSASMRKQEGQRAWR